MPQFLFNFGLRLFWQPSSLTVCFPLLLAMFHLSSGYFLGWLSILICGFSIGRASLFFLLMNPQSFLLVLPCVFLGYNPKHKEWMLWLYHTSLSRTICHFFEHLPYYAFPNPPKPLHLSTIDSLPFLDLYPSSPSEDSCFKTSPSSTLSQLYVAPPGALPPNIHVYHQRQPINNPSMKALCPQFLLMFPRPRVLPATPLHMLSFMRKPPTWPADFSHFFFFFLFA